LIDAKFEIPDLRLKAGFPNLNSGISNPESFMNRLRSQLLGIVVLAIACLLIACIRYFFKLG
jgi:hypothetical protein